MALQGIQLITQFNRSAHFHVINRHNDPASNLCYRITHSSRDSDVVAPYEKWEYFDPRVRQVEQDRNYAMNKTKKVINIIYIVSAHI